MACESFKNFIRIILVLCIAVSFSFSLPTKDANILKQNNATSQFSNATDVGSVGLNSYISSNGSIVFEVQPTVMFKFTIEAECYSQISVSWDDAITLRADLDFTVFDENQEIIIYSVGIRNPERSTYHFTNDNLGSGLFYLQVVYYDLPAGFADFTLTIQTNSTTFCALTDDQYENNQAGTFAPKIPNGKQQTLVLCNDDWFYFELPSDGVGVTVALYVEEPLNPDFIVYDTDYAVLFDSEDVDEDVIHIDLKGNHKYYLSVYDSHDPYRFTYNLTVTKDIQKKSKLGMVVGIVVGVGVPLIGAAVLSSILISRYYKKRLAFLEEENRRAKLDSSVLTVMEDLLDKYWELDYNELELGKEIGRGNFGVVYKAIWRNSACVVKQLNITNSESQDAIVEFLKEATAVKQVKNHKNVCSIFGVCTNPQYPVCIVMEYCNGGSMKELIRHRQLILDEDKIFKIAKDITGGMSHIHKENVLHLDLAARNLLVAFEGNSFTVKVADLGLARIAETGKIYGSKQSVFPIRWSAPEVLQDIKLTKAADVWSFGITMWEILEDKLPYVKLSNPEVFNFICNEKGTLSRPTRTEVPEEIWEIIQRCWIFEPENRPSFDELHKQLRKQKADEASFLVLDPGKNLELKKIPSATQQVHYEAVSQAEYGTRTVGSSSDDNLPPLEKSPTVYGNQQIVTNSNNSKVE